jgi:hypothetical protein
LLFKSRHVFYETVRLVRPKNVGEKGMIVKIGAKIVKLEYKIGMLVKFVCVSRGFDKLGGIFFKVYSKFKVFKEYYNIRPGSNSSIFLWLAGCLFGWMWMNEYIYLFK